jgi:cell division protein FtsW (lipid II flippase)
MYKLLMIVNRLLATSEQQKEKLKKIGEQINEILDTYVTPILIALGGAAAIYIVVLGVQYAKSESDDKKAEVKKRLINMVVGLLVMLGLITLCATVPWESVVQIFGYAQKTE